MTKKPSPIRYRNHILGFAAAVSASLAALLPSAAAAETTLQRYGYCGSIGDSCYHSNWYNRSTGDEAPLKALIYYHVGEGVKPHANREVGVKALTKMLQDNGYQVTSSENPDDLETTSKIMPYDAVIFFNTGRDALTSRGQMTLRLYVESGGGFVGIHNAFGTNFNWHWYEGLLGGQLFDHAPNQTAEVVIKDHKDVSTAHLGKRQQFDNEEFYNIYPDPRQLTDVRILMSVDEATMKKGTRGYNGNPGMGAGHPVTWCHYYDGGKAWLTTLGHSEEIFSDPNYLKMLQGGIDSVSGKSPFCQ